MSLAWIMRMFLKKELEKPHIPVMSQCPVCEMDSIEDGQFYHYVKRDILYKAYERVYTSIYFHEYLDLDYAIKGLTDECCEDCYYEEGYASDINKLEDYILDIKNEEVRG